MPTGYQLPLDPGSFRLALHAGLGRAVLHTSAHGIAGLEDALIESCIRNTADDPQCEPDRAGWILQIVESAGAFELILPHITRELRRTEDTWDFEHLATLAAALTRRGFDEAREALYAGFDDHRIREEWAGGRQIIELDGADGLLRVAQRLGQRLQTDQTYWINDALRDAAEERLGTDEARRVLEHAARDSAQIAAVFNQLYPMPSADASSGVKTKRERLRNPLMRVTFEQVAAAIASPATNSQLASMVGLWDWGRLAPESEIRKAAASLRTEVDPARLGRLLYIFAKRSIPDFDPALLHLLDHADMTVRLRARHAMHETKHPAIRSEAIARLAQRPLDQTPLHLLYSNFEPGDSAHILAGLPDHGEPEAIHDLVFPLVGIGQRHHMIDGAECLLWAWNKSPCSICRSRALDALQKLGPLPQWLTSEAALDANEDIRNSISKPTGEAPA